MGAPEIDERKRELRTRLRIIAKELDEKARAKADARITANLTALREYKEAEVICTYLNVGAEVDTHGIIEDAWDAGKMVALPWCVPDSRQLRWFVASSYDGLVKGPFGIKEPVACDEHELFLEQHPKVLAVVPALGFDTRGYRLGHGGGFYDTFLATFEGVSVGLCRERLLCDNLSEMGAIDAHDLPVQVVVTETRVIEAWRADDVQAGR